MSFDDELTQRIIGACIEVHRALGPGLLESAYEHCLARELDLSGLSWMRQVPLPVTYKGIELDCGYRLDFVVEARVLIELKAVEALLPVHVSQVVTYLKLCSLDVGLLINFNARTLKEGLRRLTGKACPTQV